MNFLCLKNQYDCLQRYTSGNTYSLYNLGETRDRILRQICTLCCGLERDQNHFVAVLRGTRKVRTLMKAADWLGQPDLVQSPAAFQCLFTEKPVHPCGNSIFAVFVRFAASTNLFQNPVSVLYFASNLSRISDTSLCKTSQLINFIGIHICLSSPSTVLDYLNYFLLPMSASFFLVFENVAVIWKIC